MRHLILMRHGEAGYATPGDKDFDRPLTPQGLKEAARQAQFLQRNNLTPDMVLCSPAARTKTTWNTVHEELKDALTIDFALDQPDDLYQAPPDRILTLIAAIPEHVDIVLVVAHNPGIHEAALGLAQPANGHAPSDMALSLQNGFPPASMAVFECKIRQWRDVNHQTATLRHLVKAR